MTTLISEKPAAIIVHNPDVQTYAKLLQRAENEGIYVIQINMGSNYRSSAFVGANWIEIGERDTEAVVKACEGKSNKIAIVQGALSAAASAYTLKGVENVLAKHPEVKVVSSQAADWDAAKAKAITQTVLKQNPDLCGIVGFWDGMDIGTAAAVKEAGLTGKVFVATSGGGERRGACELVKSGAFDLNLSYDVPTQAEQMAGMIKWLVSSGVKAGFGQGIDVYDADSDHQGERRQRHRLLESQRPEEIAVHPRRSEQAAVPWHGRSSRIAARPTRSLHLAGQPMQDVLLRLRYRYWPDHLLGEILSKRWTETAIPVIVLLIITILLSRAIPGFLSVGGLADTGRQAGEIGFVVLGIALVVIVGGIDLSVGSMFALCDFCALFCLNVLDWPVPAVIVGNAGLRRDARRRQRPPDRLSAAAGLHHHADHADHLSLGLRSAAVRLFQQDRGRVPRFPLLEFRRRRRGRGRAERGAGLSGRRDLRPCLPDPAAAGLARHRDRRLTPLGL